MLPPKRAGQARGRLGGSDRAAPVRANMTRGIAEDTLPPQPSPDPIRTATCWSRPFSDANHLDRRSHPRGRAPFDSAAASPRYPSSVPPRPLAADLREVPRPAPPIDPTPLMPMVVHDISEGRRLRLAPGQTRVRGCNHRTPSWADCCRRDDARRARARRRSRRGRSGQAALGEVADSSSRGADLRDPSRGRP